MRRLYRLSLWFMLLAIIAPVATGAVAGWAGGGWPDSWRSADWSSTGTLPVAADDREAMVAVYAARSGRWKGVVAVHHWIVVKRANSDAHTRYDVVGWGNPVRLNGWAPDGRWYGSAPTVVADITGEKAEAIIPAVEKAVKDYRYANYGDYRLWPGPNSNSFVAAILRDIPQIQATLPPNAIGRDFRPGAYLGWTDSGTGVEASLYGLLGVKLGWVEGLEVNLGGLVAGLDVRDPALKLPGFGRIGLPSSTANAALAPLK